MRQAVLYRWLVRSVCGLCVAATGVSCTPGSSYVVPPVDVPAAFAADGKAPLPAKWWTSFDDPQLNALIDEALAGNFSLKTAWDRLSAARALAKQAASSFWPQLNGDADAGRFVTRNGAGEPRVYTNDFSLDAVVSYEVDLWGRVRNTYDAAYLDASATEEDLRAAAISLSADVARTWYRLREQRGELAILREQVTTNEKYLKAIVLQFRRGQVAATDVLQQQQLVEATRGDELLVRQAIDLLENQLAILVGRVPGSMAIPAGDTMPTPPAMPATGVPAEWVRRRPDVRAAEIRVQAADHRMAAAIANQFPTLSLTANASTSAEALRDLFDNWLAGLAANLAAPIFDGGQRRAEVQRTKAVLGERLSDYGQVVLTGLGEVADAISQEARQVEYVQSLTKQLDLSGKAKRQILERYAKGSEDFTRYLTAILSYQNLQRTHLSARLSLLLYRIDLYQALAGGWEMEGPEGLRARGPE